MPESAPPAPRRRALITGGSRGIGARLAAVLAADGIDVTLTYRRSAEAADAVVAAIRDAGGTARAVRVELEDPDDIDALFGAKGGGDGQAKAEGGGDGDDGESGSGGDGEAETERGGRGEGEAGSEGEHMPGGERPPGATPAPTAPAYDAVIANAAASAFKPITALSAGNLQRSWETNVRSFVLLAQRAVPRMPRGGRIVAVTSYGAGRAFPNYAAIGADKAALESWVRHMAAEFGPRGVTVNAVCGGLIDTDSLHHFYGQKAMPPLADVLARVPLGRAGSRDEMAQTIRFLLSEQAGYITGQTIVVDGGLTITAPPFWEDVRRAQAPTREEKK